MSIELQTAIDSDMAVINEDGTKSYVENDPDIVDYPQEIPTYQPESEQVAEPQQATMADLPGGF